jgi:chemotaxis protein MotB
MEKTLFLLPLFILLNCGSISQDVYRRDTMMLKNQIADLEQQKDQLITEKKKLMDEMSSLTKEKGALSGDLKKAFDKIEELKTLADKRKKVWENLKASLQSMISAGQLNVKMVQGKMVVMMAEKILFDVGKSNLKAEGIQALSQLTPILSNMVGREFQVAGHTDNTGSDEKNWKLSTERALSVVNVMIEQGMPPERISATGYGKFHPVATNETPEGRTENRRIEITLVPNLEELQVQDVE